MFRKLRLDCKQFSDPALQVAVLLHNPQSANEVFLLSLRDCVVTLPETHPLREWLSQRKNLQTTTSVASDLVERLEGPLKKIWSSSHALTPLERQALIQFLDKLDEQPPYLDYTLLRGVGYLKLGNWVRTEKILADWLEREPLERIVLTPWRNDPLGKLTQGIVEDLFQSLARGLEGRLIVDAFFQGIIEFTNDEELTSAALSAQELELPEILQKLSLRYHRNLLPGFAAWLFNKETGVLRHQRFMDAHFSRSDFSSTLWAFLGGIPQSSVHRETLVRQLPALRSQNPALFYSLLDWEELRLTLTRLAPDAAKNTLKERRLFFLRRIRENPRDTWALFELIRLGQIDDELITLLSRQ
ncbi:MAG: hypothetical protein ACLGG7_06985 [Bacteriovoracia bacterium]